MLIWGVTIIAAQIKLFVWHSTEMLANQIEKFGTFVKKGNCLIVEKKLREDDVGCRM